MSFSPTVWLLLAGLIVSAPALHAQHQDILVYLENGQTHVGGYDFTVNQGDADYLVFSADLRSTEASPGAAYVDAPGWNAVGAVPRLPPGGAVLPGNTGVRFDFLVAPVLGRNLLYWNGSNSVAFGAVPDGEVVSYSTGPATTAVADGSTERVTGFTVVTTSSSGTFHKHVFFVLYGSASRDSLSADEPTDGIYLLTMAAQVAGTTDFSIPFYVLLGWNVDNAQLDQAADWVNRTLAHPPAPEFVRSTFGPTESAAFVLSAPAGHRFSLEETGDFQTWMELTPVVSTNAETIVHINPKHAAAFFRVRRIEP